MTMFNTVVHTTMYIVPNPNTLISEYVSSGGSTLERERMVQ